MKLDKCYSWMILSFFLLVLLVTISTVAHAQPNLSIADSNPRMFPVGNVDSIDIQVVVWNGGSQTETGIVNVISYSSNYRFQLLDANPISFPPTQVKRVNVRFYNDQHDGRGMANFGLTSGLLFDSITIQMYPADSVLNPGAPPMFRYNGTYVSGVVPGESKCISNAIVNRNQNAMTITSFDILNSNFTLEDIALPAVIPGGQQQYPVRICYSPGTDVGFGVRESTTLNVEYLDQQGVARVWTQKLEGITAPCLDVDPDTLWAEPTILDGWVDVTARLHNYASDSVRAYTFMTNSQSYAEISINGDAFPRDIPPHGYTDVDIRFKPRTESLNFNAITFLSDSLNQGGCGYAQLVLLGYGRLVHNDSAHLELFPKQTETLIMKGEVDATTRTFYFKNNRPDAVEVTSVALNTGDHFRITSMSPSATPFVLQPNDEMTLELEFDADANGFYRDSLIIVTNDALQSLTFSVQGLQQASSGVAAKVDASAIGLHITPNPAIGPITFSADEVRSVKFEVIDLLSNSIFSAHGPSATWNASTAAAGSYILKATGVDDQGKPFIASENFVVTR
jgi:hypothetical protein